MVREPSIHRMEERIVVTVEIIDDPNLAETIASDFLAQTGFRLEIKSQTSQSSFTVMPIPNTTISNLPNSPQIEINQAFSHIKKTFEQREVQVIKVSLKNGHQGKFIEVAFITPQVGERYLDLLAQLQTETGWKIHIRPNADEFRVKQLAKDLTKSFEVVREPSLTPGTGVVQVKILYLPTQKEEEDISNQFWELTGYTLVFEQHDIN